MAIHQSLIRTFEWIADQEKKFSKTPVIEIKKEDYEKVQDVKFYAIKRNRMLVELENN